MNPQINKLIEHYKQLRDEKERTAIVESDECSKLEKGSLPYRVLRDTINRRTGAISALNEVISDLVDLNQ